MEKWEIRPPLPQKPPNRSSPKFAWVTTSWTPTPMQNFIKIPLPPFAPQIRENSRRVTRLVFFGFFSQPTAKTPAPIFTINTSLDCITQCAHTGIHREMCSHWIALHNVLLLEYMEKCALIGLHHTTCSSRSVSRKCAPNNEMPESDFTPTAKYTLVESRNEICIQFHFLAKVLLLTCITAHVCSY